ncbi:MAG: hypothetical protein IPP90_06375 [Gemmatimonadaceae bacterium]|nr:hypothetical protein [Gemmatimonadaceae bacterium]
MTTTFSPQHLVPDGRAMLACTCLIPDGWTRLPVPDEEIDFDNRASVRSDFDRLLGAFALDEVHGMTAPILRAMTSESAIDLTAISEALAMSGSPPDAPDAADSRPAHAADVALADDAATLDPEHVINARLRDSGAGLVPRVLEVVNHEKFAVVAAAALESTFRVPFGWHVIDDGRRTLIFDVAGGVQINLSQRTSPENVYAVLQSIGDDLAAEHPQAQFLKLELLGCPCLAMRDLRIDGESLDQAYLARPSHREQCALVCRVTATRAEMTRAMNAAEVIWMSLHGPASDTDD